MKKSTFVAMILGTIGGVLFALRMCMALISEWNAFTPGVVMGVAGIFVGLVAVIVWRRMEGKQPVQVNGKTFATIVLGIVGALVMGVGMCMVMVGNMLVSGVIIGLIGITALLALIPLCKGLK